MATELFNSTIYRPFTLCWSKGFTKNAAGSNNWDRAFIMHQYQTNQAYYEYHRSGALTEGMQRGRTYLLIFLDRAARSEARSNAQRGSRSGGGASTFNVFSHLGQGAVESPFNQDSVATVAPRNFYGATDPINHSQM